MSRDPLAAAKARKAERRADEKSGGITIKPVSLPSSDKPSTGFKKGGFKNAFGSVDDEVDNKDETRTVVETKPKVEEFEVREVESESEEEWCSYDPSRPTGCGKDCPSGAGKGDLG